MKDLGGAGKEPTIVTPKQYKQRFRSAMERYFPLVFLIPEYFIYGADWWVDPR